MRLGDIHRTQAAKGKFEQDWVWKQVEVNKSWFEMNFTEAELLARLQAFGKGLNTAGSRRVGD